MKQKRAGNRVVVIGELNIDAVASGLSAAPTMGAEVLAENFQLTLGSASAIFASGIAKLSHEVTFIAKVGVDNFGDFCLAALREAGVSTRYVSRQKDLRTGVTISLSTPRDRALVTYLGAIAAMGPEDLERSRLRGHNHLHMTSYFLQTRLQPGFAQIFRDAKELGLSTSFDPNSDPAQVWTAAIRDVLAYTDLLFLNEAEALQLTRARTAAAALKALGKEVSCAIIKRGARGALAIKGDDVISARAFKVKAVDPTGAGDSFAAGFVSYYLRNRSLAECLDAGNACGALSTLRAGGTAGQPTRQALQRFLGERRADWDY